MIIYKVFTNRRVGNRCETKLQVATLSHKQAVKFADLLARGDYNAVGIVRVDLDDGKVDVVECRYFKKEMYV